MAAQTVPGAIHHHQAELVGLVGFQELSFRHAHANIRGERRIRDGLGGEAFISAGLLHGGHHESLQHSRSVLRCRQGNTSIKVAACIQTPFEKIQFLAAEGVGRLVEGVFFEAFERSA